MNNDDWAFDQYAPEYPTVEEAVNGAVQRHTANCATLDDLLLMKWARLIEVAA